ncbi:MAG: sigma 54-interacting transcriptional regulator [Alphaproteobacteria bacterium]|uniref:Sigma 54-interacting transcriptional regulator n=1 Tax=Candidatus Nitrobium versatile TaxID=2884831 RepID=A0A953JDH0_9BACT|nr:sigma 54-interacting transcriptional regulator [Candidatus Nitrobium versatile]
MSAKILVIDDEESIRFTFESFLQEEGHTVSTARDYEEALDRIAEGDFDLIFTDIILGGKTGVDILKEVKERNLNCPVVIITGYPSLDTATDAVRLGAFDYLPKPVKQETLLHITRMALQHKALSDEKERYRSNLEAIFRSVKDALITVDRDLSLVEVNEAASKICGLTRPSRGRSLPSLPEECNRSCLSSLEATIRSKQPNEIHRLECQHRQRPLQVVNITTYPLLDHKRVFSGAIMVVRDETRLADLERDMRERQQFFNLIGKSERMQEIYALIEDLADVQTTVLITGESGTGKELVAEALHYRGVRSSKPFVKVNCSALSESLLESELFGHVKGAFTGAVKDKIGRFQRADGGTIFLDEIGDITPRMQLRLLRVLQEMEFERVGDSTPIKVDVRVVAATNRNLREKVKLGEFREDLYYRLKVVEVTLPPLRERREDIPLLIDYFIKKFNNKLNKAITGVSSEVQRILVDHAWSGNVRELEHTLEHACVLCRKDFITVDDLPSDFRDSAGAQQPNDTDSRLDEPRAIVQALEKTAWNKAKAARLLGISRRTIYRKINDYKLVPPE